ncbi:MAG: carbohydrate ABC transporter permease [Candidatus Bipolaricaulota bacterium]|nr:carbohydrate ABC transporter permease [Candidatus Bipolaricaulota bacterium]MDW8127206.1 carbohydrate ABC transporter permease [Candidatus Bipolaricaulota bacterium]
MSTRRVLKNAILYPLLLMVVAVALLPIGWLLSTSLKTPLEFLGGGISLIPRQPTLAHYQEVLFERGFLRFLGNTAVVASAATALSLWTGSLAAYALTRFRFPCKLDAIFLLWALVVRTIPPIVLVVPLFILFRELRLTNVRVILILAYQIYTLPLTVWMLLGFFREIPREVEEAALIDGASRLQALARVVYPLVMPGLAASAIFCIITTWNEFTYALIFARVPADFTIPIGIATFITEYRTLWGPLAAGGLISSLPLLGFTVFVQRYLLRGFALRGVF